MYLMLGLDSSLVPEEVIQAYLDVFTVDFTGNDCFILYHTTISIYNWLIRKANATAVNGKRREKKGRREIEVEDFNSANNWQAALDNFTKKPWETYPQCIGMVSTIGSRIIIGGTKKDVVESVNCNTNSYNRYSERSPFSPDTGHNTTGNKLKF